MADECTDISSVKELSLYCRWEEGGGCSRGAFPGDHPLAEADAQSIYSALIECLIQKYLQVSRIVGMGFDGASTFSGKKTGVQTHIKTLAPHALFVHCHLLQLAYVQAPGIMHVYTTLMALRKFFHFSPKRTESLERDPACT